MKRASLLCAAAILVGSNALALLHAWRNRSGPADAEITLSQRVLAAPSGVNEEDSGVSLYLGWVDPAWASGWEGRHESWVDQAKLGELGFDTSVAPAAQNAQEFYQRQRARRCFVALEHGGAGWRKYVEAMERMNERNGGKAQAAPSPDSPTVLIAVDADRDAARLRGRHADRGSVIILPAVARIMLEIASPAYGNRPASEARLYGTIEGVRNSIHVPRPYSDGFRSLPKDWTKARYQVHLRYGASYEPWITGVEFGKAE